MTTGTLPIADVQGTRSVGHALGERLRPGDVVLLGGDLGAGKTTLARAALAALGLAGEAPSPSYALVLDYRPPEVRLPILHADLYRLDRPGEMAELGLDDLAGEALLVEWPERAGEGRWPGALQLLLEPDRAGRRLTWIAPPSWETRWPPDRA